MKRSEVSIKTRSTPASLSFKGQAIEHTTVKWSIRGNKVIKLLPLIHRTVATQNHRQRKRADRL